MGSHERSGLQVESVSNMAQVLLLLLPKSLQQRTGYTVLLEDVSTADSFLCQACALQVKYLAQT